MSFHDLTLGIARGACMRRQGFTDLSRLMGRDRSRPGQCYLPDKEFRSVGPTSFLAGWTLSWCSSIHLLGDAPNLLDAILRQLLVPLHHQKHLPNILLVDAFL